ncbi:MAG: hypothetical protein OXG30_02330 [bacterium]|nr:hypothetical protein [bacterium]MCY3889594.1 hypothetical protein [bacterium]MCY4133739.1 hypothetical protein [bacterium]
MSIEVIAQMATMALAVLAIIWHQQRSTDKLRDDFSQATDKLRDDFSQATDKLQTGLAANGQRLARIEGFLGIGMPTAVADKAAGAEVAHPPTPG